MKLSLRILLGGCLVIYPILAMAQGPVSSFSYVMSLMQQRDLQALKRFTASGGRIDALDRNGLTPLCHAMRLKDYQGFELLKSQGAHSESLCRSRLSHQEQEAFYKNQPDRNTYYIGTNRYTKEVHPSSRTALSDNTLLWGGVGVAGAVGVVALAAGGGGGSDSSTGNDTSSPSDNPDPAPGPDAEAFNTAEYRYSRALTSIKAAEAFARGYSGQGVRVAVLDTGVYHHTDLDDNIIGGYNFDYGPCRVDGDRTNCYNYENGLLYLLYKDGQKQLIGSINKDDWESYYYSYASWYDWDAQQDDWTPSGYLASDNIHGTHVAGLIAALRNDTGMEGVAPEAGLIIGRADLWDTFSEATLQLFDMNPDIINISLGFSGITAASANQIIDNVTGFEYYIGSEGLNFFKKAAETNTILVFAAGNDGLNDASIFAAAPEANALKGYQLDNLVVSVVSVDSNLQIADYSNRCGTTAQWCIAAPGGTSGSPIFSTSEGDGYIGLFGTSMAAPTVSGSLAVLLGAFPNLTPQNAVQILFDTATDLGEIGVDSVYGHGLVNLEEATRPQGVLKLALTDSPDTHLISLDQAALSLPKALGEKALSALPSEVMVLDKYDRSFFMNTRQLVRSTDTSFYQFKRTFRAFTNQPTIQKLTPSDTFSLRFSTPISSYVSDWNAGLLEMTLQPIEHLKIRAFYTEDTQFFDTDFNMNRLKNPFMALKDAYGIHNTYQMTSSISFGFQTAIGRSGLVALTEDDYLDRVKQQSYTFAAETNYQPTSNISLTSTVGLLSEADSLLGIQGEDSFHSPGADTYFIGLAFQWQTTPRLTLTGSYFYGSTKPDTQQDIFQFKDLKSQQLAVDLRYQMTPRSFGGIQAIMPLTTSGRLTALLPVGRDYETDTVILSQQDIALKPTAQEWQFNTYYTTDIGKRWLLRSEAGMRLHPDGIRRRQPDWRVMLGMSYKY